MPFQIPEKLKNLKPYNPDELNYPIILNANESPCNADLGEFGKILSNIKTNRYPDPMARDLCKSYGDFLGVNPELITAGNGSDELISVIVQSFLQKGDKIAILEPDFTMYEFYATINECEIVRLQKSADLKINVDDVLTQISENRINMLIFSNPCSPTSLGLTRECVRRLIKSAECLVALDEAYMDFWNQSLVSEIEDYDNLIILRTASKMSGLASLRLGFAIVNGKLTSYLKAAKSPYNVNSLTQAIAGEFFKNKDLLTKSRDEILQNTKFLYDELRKISSIKTFETCTNFVLIEPKNVNELDSHLKQNGILVRKIGKYLRITSGTMDENITAVAAIQNFEE